jgi:ubiquitin-protein ligase
MGIRETRLENDFNEVSQLIANSGGTIALISSQGKPAYEYVIEYRCKGIERLQGNDPVFRTNHRVKITLSNDYPKNSPSAEFLTPIFHPNVYTNQRVCLGSYWTMAENLSELVIRIGKIIQYSKDVLNLNSPANGDAKDWANRNPNRYPVDNKTFKSAKKPQAQIVWNDL